MRKGQERIVEVLVQHVEWRFCSGKQGQRSALLILSASSHLPPLPASALALPQDPLHCSALLRGTSPSKLDAPSWLPSPIRAPPPLSTPPTRRSSCHRLRTRLVRTGWQLHRGSGRALPSAVEQHGLALVVRCDAQSLERLATMMILHSKCVGGLRACYALRSDSCAVCSEEDAMKTLTCLIRGRTNW